MNELYPEQKNITELLRSWQSGNREAKEKLMEIVYDELKRRAHIYIRKEGRNHTLQTAGLVNEAYLRLVEQRTDWQSRAHFFAIAAKMMRRILVDYAKNRTTLKRGGKAENLVLEEIESISGKESKLAELIELDEALKRLEKLSESQARVVEYRYFGGLSVEETAQVLGIAPRTVKEKWKVAKAWLYSELTTGNKN